MVRTPRHPTVVSTLQTNKTTAYKSSTPQVCSLTNGARRVRATGSLDTRVSPQWHQTVVSTLETTTTASRSSLPKACPFSNGVVKAQATGSSRAHGASRLHPPVASTLQMQATSESRSSQWGSSRRCHRRGRCQVLLPYAAPDTFRNHMSMPMSLIPEVNEIWAL